MSHNDVQTPAEVCANPAHPRTYARVAAEKDDLRRPYQLPAEYTKDVYDATGSISEFPLVVFINSRSGGRMGSELTLAFNRHLGRHQVFDLSKDKPDKVLTKLWSNFKQAAESGDQAAAIYQSRLPILAAGGDGTIAWVLATLKALNLKPEPPVAIIPLGTGNDLSRSFGWGPGFDKDFIKSHQSMHTTLRRLAVAQEEELDCWQVSMHLPTPDLKCKVPYSLKALPSTANGGCSISGMFWNYMSIGLDAKAAHGFHDLREREPWITAGRISNQMVYAGYSCTSGWFCCTKPLSSRAKIQVQQPGSDSWQELELPSQVKALVLLNLQSYAGGRNLWGKTESGDKYRKPTYNDGLLEVVGLTNGYHTGLVMASKGNLVHAMRICQASGLRLQLRAKHIRPDGAHSHAYLQVDGEPWVQNLPSSRDAEPITIEITNFGSSKMLKNSAGLYPTRLSKKWEAQQKRKLAQLAGESMRAAGHEQVPVVEVEAGPSSPAMSNIILKPSTMSVATENTNQDSDAAQVGSLINSSPPQSVDGTYQSSRFSGVGQGGA